MDATYAAERRGRRRAGAIKPSGWRGACPDGFRVGPDGSLLGPDGARPGPDEAFRAARAQNRRRARSAVGVSGHGTTHTCGASLLAGARLGCAGAIDLGK